MDNIIEILVSTLDNTQLTIEEAAEKAKIPLSLLTPEIADAVAFELCECEQCGSLSRYMGHGDICPSCLHYMEEDDEHYDNYR